MNIWNFVWGLMLWYYSCSGIFWTSISKLLNYWMTTTTEKAYACPLQNLIYTCKVSIIFYSIYWCKFSKILKTMPWLKLVIAMGLKHRLISLRPHAHGHLSGKLVSLDKRLIWFCSVSNSALASTDNCTKRLSAVVVLSVYSREKQSSCKEKKEK